MLQNRSKATRFLSVAIAVIFLLVSILACTEPVNAVSKLKITASKKTIYVGQTLKVKANKNVKWSVSNKKIARLTGTKKKQVTVKALKKGTVYVKAKAGKKTVKVKLTIKAKSAVKGPTKINILATRDTIGIGENCSVFVDSVVPESESRDVIFSSSNEKVAVISSSGLVTGISKGEATLTATSKVNKNTKASVNIRVVPTKAGTVTLNIDMSDEERYPAGEKAKVWVPIPVTDDNQSITTIRYDKDIASIRNNSAGEKQLYIEWGEDVAPADRKTSLSYHIYRKAIVRDEDLRSKEKGSVNRAQFAEELKETRWSGNLTSGIVKETADKIVRDAHATTVYDKAHAIYDWMCDNLVRTDDKTVIFGDVASILKGERNAGSCMDMNSVFVALCRAEGIPARDPFGLRFTTGGPNCRAEFYLPGYGWVPADPALAIKQGRGLDAPPKHDHDRTWENIKDNYWGSAEENWICLTNARDVTLDPPQSVVTETYKEVLNPVNSQGVSTLNLFMFPYGEYGDQYIPCQDTANFKYKYSFEEEDPLDCGC